MNEGPADPPNESSTGRRLRITLVEFLPSGGMFQFGFQFAEALARAGHEVTLLTGPQPELRSRTRGLRVLELLPTWHPNAKPESGPVRRRSRRAWRAVLLLESWRRVLRHLRRTRPDVVQFGELRYVLDTAAFLMVTRYGRAGLVVDVAHNPVPYDVHGGARAVEKSGRITRGLLGRAYRSAGLLLVLGETPRRQLLQAFSGLRHVAVCGHGDYTGVVDRAVPVPVPSTAGPSALFFGAWTKYKNIPLLLDSFELVRAVLPGARLTLAGPPMPDVDLDEIQARAAEVGNVTSRPQYVPMDELPALFAAHRVVVFTYDTVNVSGSVHMAYTFGRPVVATDVGAMSDVVRQGETGFLTPPTPRSIADALLVILQDEAAADRMGAAAAAATDAAPWAAVAGRALAAYRAESLS